MGLEGHSGETSIVIERIIENWDEQSITWNNQPATSSNNPIIIPDYSDPQKDYLNLDVTQLIKDSYKKPESSFGLMLKYNNEAPYKVSYFASSNHSDKSKRPTLKIYFH